MGKRLPFIFAALMVLLLLGGAVAVYAYDSGRDDLIAKGVTVAGIDVGEMRRGEATRLVQRRLGDPLNRSVFVRAAGKRYRLTAERAEVTLDVGGMVAEAVRASRDGNLLERSWRGLTGDEVDKDVELKVTYSDDAVARLVRRVRRAVNRDPKDASVQATASGLQMVKSRDGRRLEDDELGEQIEVALRTPDAERTIVAKSRLVEPKVTTDNLADKYPYYIVVNRPAFQLTLYERLQRKKTYKIAVGKVGLETPAGLYNVQNKAVNPAWYVPNSEWAGDLAGKVIPGDDPTNPIKARWLGIYDGAGIHGTDAVSSLGTAASHGCIRMAIPDVIELYDQVPVGAPVYIA